MTENWTVIHFVRHGEVFNPGNIYYGRLMGFPLSHLGREKLSCTKDYFQQNSIAAIYRSPQLRTQQTAEIIKENQPSGSIFTTDLLNEVHSPYDGRPLDELKAIDFDVYTGSSREFEQPNDVLSRGLAFIRGICTGHISQEVIAVTHGDLIAFIRLWAEKKECTPANKADIYKNSLNYGSITTLTFEPKPSAQLIDWKYVDPTIDN
ncbi:MAG: histidine phosphatase family protein [Symploca sp. SIO1B1]|nr:histidine phosphatase family protein [Symploca sp. SIO1C2]NER96590.1 histidine phosphatase family protein [Symploca sp. SIO1B1]